MSTRRRIRLPDGRALAVDDVGAPDGAAVLYIHGTPDSRLARHPDDALAARAGVRLLAIDRPGTGDSDPHPDAGLDALGRDLVTVLDELGLDRAALLGWSSGGLAALAAAAVLGDRVTAVTAVAPVPPVEAYADQAVVDSLGPARRPFVELALELAPAELAGDMAGHLVPMPLTAELALDHVLDGAGAAGRAELATVPGAAEQLARALEGAVRQGLEGLEADLVLQLTPGLDLTQVQAPVRLVHGELDPVAPPAVGEWLLARLPDATLEVIPGAAHHLLFPLWTDLLEGRPTE